MGTGIFKRLAEPSGSWLICRETVAVGISLAAIKGLILGMGDLGLGKTSYAECFGVSRMAKIHC